MALLNGAADPVGMLALNPEDWAVGVAVVAKADEIALERRTVEIENIGVAVANAIGRAMR